MRNEFWMHWEPIWACRLTLFSLAYFNFEVESTILENMVNENGFEIGFEESSMQSRMADDGTGKNGCEDLNLTVQRLRGVGQSFNENGKPYCMGHCSHKKPKG